jgi:hypothetical protein
VFSGYFHISEHYRISYVGFDAKDNFDWSDAPDAGFIDAATLKFSSIVNWEDREQEGAKTKKRIFSSRKTENFGPKMLINKSGEIRKTRMFPAFFCDANRFI